MGEEGWLRMMASSTWLIVMVMAIAIGTDTVALILVGYSCYNHSLADVIL